MNIQQYIKDIRKNLSLHPYAEFVEPQATEETPYVDSYEDAHFKLPKKVKQQKVLAKSSDNVFKSYRNLEACMKEIEVDHILVGSDKIVGHYIKDVSHLFYLLQEVEKAYQVEKGCQPLQEYAKVCVYPLTKLRKELGSHVYSQLIVWAQAYGFEEPPKGVVLKQYEATHKEWGIHYKSLEVV